MGLVCACFGLSSPGPKSSPDLNDHNVGVLTPPKVQVMNSNGSNRDSINTKKKMHFSLQEIQKQYEEEKRDFTTFKEWLLASPPTNGYYSNNGDEILQRNSQKQNKVHPSFVEDCPDYGYSNGKSCSKKRHLVGGEVDSCSSMDDRVPSLRKNGSKNTKKRVSFRLPEEADVFIYNLTEED